MAAIVGNANHALLGDAQVGDAGDAQVGDAQVGVPAMLQQAIALVEAQVVHPMLHRNWPPGEVQRSQLVREMTQEKTQNREDIINNLSLTNQLPAQNMALRSNQRDIVTQVEAWMTDQVQAVYTAHDTAIAESPTIADDALIVCCVEAWKQGNRAVCIGIPGSGKTMLMSEIATLVQKTKGLIRRGRVRDAVWRHFRTENRWIITAGQKNHIKEARKEGLDPLFQHGNQLQHQRARKAMGFPKKREHAGLVKRLKITEGQMRKQAQKVYPLEGGEQLDPVRFASSYGAVASVPKLVREVKTTRNIRRGDAFLIMWDEGDEGTDMSEAAEAHASVRNGVDLRYNQIPVELDTSLFLYFTGTPSEEQLGNPNASPPVPPMRVISNYTYGDGLVDGGVCAVEMGIYRPDGNIYFPGDTEGVDPQSLTPHTRRQLNVDPNEWENKAKLGLNRMALMCKGTEVPSGAYVPFCGITFTPAAAAGNQNNPLVHQIGEKIREVIRNGTGQGHDLMDGFTTQELAAYGITPESVFSFHSSLSDHEKKEGFKNIYNGRIRWVVSDDLCRRGFDWALLKVCVNHRPHEPCLQPSINAFLQGPLLRIARDIDTGDGPVRDLACQPNNRWDDALDAFGELKEAERAEGIKPTCYLIEAAHNCTQDHNGTVGGNHRIAVEFMQRHNAMGALIVRSQEEIEAIVHLQLTDEAAAAEAMQEDVDGIDEDLIEVVPAAVALVMDENELALAAAEEAEAAAMDDDPDFVPLALTNNASNAGNAAPVVPTAGGALLLSVEEELAQQQAAQQQQAAAIAARAAPQREADERRLQQQHERERRLQARTSDERQTWQMLPTQVEYVVTRRGGELRNYYKVSVNGCWPGARHSLQVSEEDDRNQNPRGNDDGVESDSSDWALYPGNGMDDLRPTAHMTLVATVIATPTMKRFRFRAAPAANRRDGQDQVVEYPCIEFTLPNRINLHNLFENKRREFEERERELVAQREAAAAAAAAAAATSPAPEAAPVAASLVAVAASLVRMGSPAPTVQTAPSARVSPVPVPTAPRAFAPLDDVDITQTEQRAFDLQLTEGVRIWPADAGGHRRVEFPADIQHSGAMVPVLHGIADSNNAAMLRDLAVMCDLLPGLPNLITRMRNRLWQTPEMRFACNIHTLIARRNEQFELTGWGGDANYIPATDPALQLRRTWNAAHPTQQLDLALFTKDTTVDDTQSSPYPPSATQDAIFHHMPNEFSEFSAMLVEYRLARVVDLSIGNQAVIGAVHQTALAGHQINLPNGRVSLPINLNFAYMARSTAVGAQPRYQMSRRPAAQSANRLTDAQLNTMRTFFPEFNAAVEQQILTALEGGIYINGQHIQPAGRTRTKYITNLRRGLYFLACYNRVHSSCGMPNRLLDAVDWAVPRALADGEFGAWCMQEGHVTAPSPGNAGTLQNWILSFKILQDQRHDKFRRLYSEHPAKAFTTTGEPMPQYMSLIWAKWDLDNDEFYPFRVLGLNWDEENHEFLYEVEAATEDLRHGAGVHRPGAAPRRFERHYGSGMLDCPNILYAWHYRDQNPQRWGNRRESLYAELGYQPNPTQ